MDPRSIRWLTRQRMQSRLVVPPSRPIPPTGCGSRRRRAPPPDGRHSPGEEPGAREQDRGEQNTASTIRRIAGRCDERRKAHHERFAQPDETMAAADLPRKPTPVPGMGERSTPADDDEREEATKARDQGDAIGHVARRHRDREDHGGQATADPPTPGLPVHATVRRPLGAPFTIIAAASSGIARSAGPATDPMSSRSIRPRTGAATSTRAAVRATRSARRGTGPDERGAWRFTVGRNQRPGRLLLQSDEDTGDGEVDGPHDREVGVLSRPPRSCDDDEGEPAEPAASTPANAARLPLGARRGCQSLGRPAEEERVGATAQPQRQPPIRLAQHPVSHHPGPAHEAVAAQVPLEDALEAARRRSARRSNMPSVR